MSPVYIADISDNHCNQLQLQNKNKRFLLVLFCPAFFQIYMYMYLFSVTGCSLIGFIVTLLKQFVSYVTTTRFIWEDNRIVIMT